MPISLLLLGAWACAVSFFDIRERRVPNWLVGLGFVFACISFALARDALRVTLLQCLLGLVLALVVFVPFYAMRAMGAADVKVFAVLGLWLGVGALIPIWLWASVAAGVHAIYAIAVKRPLPVMAFGRMPPIGSSAGGWIRGAPYAAFLTLAALGWVVIQHASQLSIF